MVHHLQYTAHQHLLTHLQHFHTHIQHIVCNTSISGERSSQGAMDLRLRVPMFQKECAHSEELQAETVADPSESLRS